jgi:hypothetical protein
MRAIDEEMLHPCSASRHNFRTAKFATFLLRKEGLLRKAKRKEIFSAQESQALRDDVDGLPNEVATPLKCRRLASLCQQKAHQ